MLGMIRQLLQNGLAYQRREALLNYSHILHSINIMYISGCMAKLMCMVSGYKISINWH